MENSNFVASLGRTDYPGLLVLEAAAYFRPNAKRGLQIGLGGGGLPTLMSKRHGIPFDAVEIDSAIVRIAQRYFDYHPSGDVVVADGRSYVAHTKRTYDIIVLDAFTSDQLPSHLMSVEFFRELKSRMAPDGVLAINFVRMEGFGKTKTEPWEYVDRTLSDVFANVRRPVYMFPPIDGVAFGHVLFFASNGPLAMDRPLSSVPNDLQQLWTEAFARELPRDPNREKTLPLITDDFNPLESLVAPIFVRYRRALMRQNRELLQD